MAYVQLVGTDLSLSSPELTAVSPSQDGDFYTLFLSDLAGKFPEKSLVGSPAIHGDAGSEEENEERAVREGMASASLVPLFPVLVSESPLLDVQEQENFFSFPSAEAVKPSFLLFSSPSSCEGKGEPLSSLFRPLIEREGAPSLLPLTPLVPTEEGLSSAQPPSCSLGAAWEWLSKMGPEIREIGKFLGHEEEKVSDVDVKFFSSLPSAVFLSLQEERGGARLENLAFQAERENGLLPAGKEVSFSDPQADFFPLEGGISLTEAGPFLKRGDLHSPQEGSVLPQGELPNTESLVEEKEVVSAAYGTDEIFSGPAPLHEESIARARKSLSSERFELIDSALQRGARESSLGQVVLAWRPGKGRLLLRLRERPRSSPASFDSRQIRTAWAEARQPSTFPLDWINSSSR